MEKIKKVLANQENNHILPFMWVHGESEFMIRKHIEKIAQSGIRALCVESRPHPDFLGEKWWQDLAIIIDEAKKHDMKIWILDDAHFPTGYANGAIIKKHPEFRKLFLKIKQLDYHGPQQAAGIIVKWHAGGDRNSIINVGVEDSHTFQKEEKILAVLAAKIVDYQTVETESMIDLTAKMHQGVVYWDVPEGNWRIFVLIESFSGGESSTEGYLNPIDPRATQVLIDEVYQAHYDHLGAEFGETILGFFSDEPRFGNVKGPEAIIGKLDMALPWRGDLLEILQAETDKTVLKLLPLLVCDGTSQSSLIRYLYMDVVSKLYSENFSGKLAEWCQQHQVDYIGHVIEDNNAHARLGYGAGHFFRAIDKQSMSGIDVVLHQLLPGLDTDYYKTFTSTGWDGEFFHYALAKLGASFAHIDPKKKGRTMVELFGAFGWSEGLNFMKWLADQFLVSGVNYFVPHAFDLAPFPDTDCPPHFYAHGHDLQFPYFKQLMQYMNRTAELISDGVHIKNAFILYHAEAEWSGEAMLVQKPAKALIQAQIDFDILPIDLLGDMKVSEKQLTLNQQNADVLIVPYAERLPQVFFERLSSLLVEGANVIFLENLPAETSEGTSISAYFDTYRDNQQVKCLPLDQLVENMHDSGFDDIHLSNHQPFLKYHHYRHDDGEVYLFFNTSSDTSLETLVTIKETGYLYDYQAMSNRLFKQNLTDNASLPLNLAPQESKIFILSNQAITAESHPIFKRVETELLTLDWKVSLSDASHYPEVQEQFTMTQLENIAQPDYFPTFSGMMIYESNFEMLEISKKSIYEIDLGEVYDIATVSVNGNKIDTKISKPYVFDVTTHLVTGSNKFKIEIINTLGTQQQDFLSQYRLLQPSGLLGPVSLYQKISEKN